MTDDQAFDHRSYLKTVSTMPGQGPLAARTPAQVHTGAGETAELLPASTSAGRLDDESRAVYRHAARTDHPTRLDHRAQGIGVTAGQDAELAVLEGALGVAVDRRRPRMKSCVSRRRRHTR